MKRNVLIVITGAIVAVMALALVKLGNPQNMGICIACFLRDIAGGVGLHRAAVVQYIRPEIIGLALGAFLTSIFTKEYRSLGGSRAAGCGKTARPVTTGAGIPRGVPSTH